MTGALIILIVFAVVILVVALWAIATYNGLVTQRNRFKNAYSQIDVQLQRRHDLIPNLVETAKGYLSHERETLERVIAARNQAVGAAKTVSADPSDAQAMSRLLAAEGQLTAGLSRLLAISESYPDLKANQTMAQLMEELSSTENKVAFARQAYNDGVMQYNTAREVFPASIIAGTFQFKEAMLYEVVDPTVKEAPKVKF